MHGFPFWGSTLEADLELSTARLSDVRKSFTRCHWKAKPKQVAVGGRLREGRTKAILGGVVGVVLRICGSEAFADGVLDQLSHTGGVQL